MHIYVKNTLLILKKQDTTKIINYAQLINIVASKDNRYDYYFFYFTLIFLNLIMENKINEAYIDNLNKYIHLLTVNEIFEEIKKVKAFINNLRFSNQYEENKKDLYKKATNTVNNLSKLYFSKSAQ